MNEALRRVINSRFNRRQDDAPETTNVRHQAKNLAESIAVNMSVAGIEDCCLDCFLNDIEAVVAKFEAKRRLAQDELGDGASE